MSVSPSLTRRIRAWAALACTSVFCTALCFPQHERSSVPVVLDTDVGNDIDDAFAIAMLLKMPTVRLVGVTTVSGDTLARARVAAKLLAAGARPNIPVAAGTPQPAKPEAQLRWAADFHGTALRATSAENLLKEAVEQGGGRTVILAIGPLTNVAALLQGNPAIARKIARIVLMGGSLHHGYYPGSSAIAESNIASDAAAAQQVFQSGVPITMVPLDATAQTQMDAAHLAQLFNRPGPLPAALQQLYRLWGQPVPTLHDALAAGMLTHPAYCRTEPLHITVTADGWTRVSSELPNATVAVQCDPSGFLRSYEDLFAR